MMKSAIAVLAAIFALAALAPMAPAEAKKGTVLKGKSYYKYSRPGYKKLKKSDTYETRKFSDPAIGPRAQNQPFDNGWFFETPTGPFGGYTPYMH